MSDYQQLNRFVLQRTNYANYYIWCQLESLCIRKTVIWYSFHHNYYLNNHYLG